jgi:AbiV family abortive infection protein
MPMSAVTPEYLVRGYALALEQCGRLLLDACALYERGSFANAVVLAAFAREELGRSQILLDLWREGSPVTVKQIEAKCVEHVKKQLAGMLSLTYRADRNAGLGKILVALTTNPHSRAWKDAKAQLEKMDAKMKRQTPNRRHMQRMTALYVEPKSPSEWNRPADLAAEEACRVLQDAMNDYLNRYQQGYVGAGASILQDTCPRLYRALEQMPDRPNLPAPVKINLPSHGRTTKKTPKKAWKRPRGP